MNDPDEKLTCEEAKLLLLVSRSPDKRGEPLKRLLLLILPNLRRHIRAKLRGQPQRRFDEDDVLQETLTAAVQSIDNASFSSPAEFHAWLETIAGNKLRNLHRDQFRMKRDARREQRINTGSRSGASLIGLLTAELTSASRMLIREEQQAAVMTSLLLLSDEHREVIECRILHNMNVAETAQRLGRSHDATHALLTRALRALRRHVQSATQFLSGLR